MKPVEPFKTGDAASYDGVAESFAHFTELVTKPLAGTMVRMAKAPAGSRILDVGTGTGIVALSAASVAQAVITGIDLSDGLLATAAGKIAAAGLQDRISLRKGDAEALPFEDASFDCVLSLYALLHFPHPETALKEMFRVLRPGGCAVIGIGSGPPWTTLSGWVHRLGRAFDLVRLWRGTLLLAPAQLNQLVEKHLPMAAQTEETDLAMRRQSRSLRAAEMVRRVGFRGVETHWEGHRLKLRDAAESWELQSTFSSLARKRLPSASASQVQALRREFDEQCGRVLARGGEQMYHSGAYFIRATRPR